MGTKVRLVEISPEHYEVQRRKEKQEQWDTLCKGATLSYVQDVFNREVFKEEKRMKGLRVIQEKEILSPEQERQERSTGNKIAFAIFLAFILTLIGLVNYVLNH